MDGYFFAVPSWCVTDTHQMHQMEQLVTRLVFRTLEQNETLRTGSFKSFWRLRDPMCTRFLSIGSAPEHFLAANAFFPFIREASVLRLPRNLNLMPTWLGLAFHAGYLFGANLPTAAAEIWQSNVKERSEALRRLKLMCDKLGEYPASPRNLF